MTASSEVVVTADRFRKMEEVYKNTCTYLGEDYRHTEPDDLNKYILDFVTAFKVSATVNPVFKGYLVKGHSMIRRHFLRTMSCFTDIKKGNCKALVVKLQ